MDTRRKRLLYRANYRGFKEADILLGGFAKENIATLTENEITMFENLLSAKDHDIYDWITQKSPVPGRACIYAGHQTAGDTRYVHCA